MTDSSIVVEGAYQNNLQHVDVELPLGEMIVVTGVSGSGKSSLAFDTIYAEGQRRYVETFSAYARQFLERMDKPRVDRIDGIPPAIAIDQTNPVRTSRSTVGTMTEVNDHLKLLFARFARLYCGQCDRLVRRDSPDSIFDAIGELFAATDDTDRRFMLTFTVNVPDNFSTDECIVLLDKQGFSRILSQSEESIEVIHSRLVYDPERRARIVDDIESALRHGHGRLAIRVVPRDGEPGPPVRFSTQLHCPDCDLDYRDPIPNTFSFNSPIGACEECNGFGRVLGIDYELAVPDKHLTLQEGAVKPWQSGAYSECQQDLVRFARMRGIPLNLPWCDMSLAHRTWVLQGEGSYDDGKWYGVKRFFEWLEKKSYKMHVRVMLSRYRTDSLCPSCGGTRLKSTGLLWRIGPDRGLNIFEVQSLPLSECLGFFHRVALPGGSDSAAEMLLDRIRERLSYLVEVGVDYLTLDRQSRTLSGGEVQRINLTTALGTSLVNTLFVLDEPSIGLHPRDIRRLIGVLQRLRDAGNTLLIVEHDPEVILAADRVIDMGPGPGEQGGNVLYAGPLPGLLACPESVTARYLSGKAATNGWHQPRSVDLDNDLALRLRGATMHNLVDVDVAIPMQRLTCITGVSGSGKSTLVQDVLHGEMRALFQGVPKDMLQHCSTIEGVDRLGFVEMVDQSAIGRTTRSTPVSYVKAWDSIRKLFAKTELARRRGYKAGTFSFNTGGGRCPTCEGNGFEHVEMQFLSDVYLRCPDCGGRRYSEAVLEVTLDGNVSVADVLDMSVDAACVYFEDHADIVRSLEPLRAVGLGYIRLGQPVPTLSGGEAQRLKLAGHLAGRSAAKTGDKPGLFLFDEPTTGLHFRDIEQLLDALQRLVDEGHTVLVIEHNLDVIRAADWIIDLGPEGGKGGGRIVCCGSPEAVAAHPESHTGKALRDYEQATTLREAPLTDVALQTVAALSPAKRNGQAVHIHNAREHNLRGVDIDIPHDAFTVVTGVSGSGKSTVAFDILFAEGQRRYLESLNAYSRQFVQPVARPDVDEVLGVPPTVAIEQRTSRGGRKSTVGTVTEIYQFLRLLFVKLGQQMCPDCQVAIESQTPLSIAARIIDEAGSGSVQLYAPLVVARKGYYTDLAAWMNKQGFDTLRVDGVNVPTDPWPRLDRFREHTIDLPVAQLTPATDGRDRLVKAIEEVLRYSHGLLRCHIEGQGETLHSLRRCCPECGRSFPELDPRLFSYNSRHGWCPSCQGTGLEDSGTGSRKRRKKGAGSTSNRLGGTPCKDCGGARLKDEALAVLFRDKSVAEFAGMSVATLEDYFADVELTDDEKPIARDIVTEIRSRLEFLDHVGLSYLTLDRGAPTLSGGEAQRIRLASQLGSNLRGVCYILDEPTIGLHTRDNAMLLSTLHQLRQKGNTVVVVEHDEATMREADHIIDLGPGAGELGGEVVVAGTLDEVSRHPLSVTGRFLREPLKHPLEGASRRSCAKVPTLRVSNARLHNLRNLTVDLPLSRLVCVTGVSGSGKSTLIRDVLMTNLEARIAARREGGKAEGPYGCDTLEGWKGIGRALEVNQTPIGKTPRSCPATYVGFWDDVRRLFASMPEAALRGFGPGRFSFNVKGGRCEECKGFGEKKIEMSFLPDVHIPCDACEGRRFNDETLDVTFRDRTIADVLAMSIEDAVKFFESQRSIRQPLELLEEVGLGYLRLGQPSPTLSGGEAQRIKLVTELAKAPTSAANVADQTGKRSAHTFYLLDEPTIGLHMADVEKLIQALHRLVDVGHTVVVIEHNLDVIAEADWIIDLGPEGGVDGGRVVTQGTPGQVARKKVDCYTGPALADFLEAHSK